MSAAASASGDRYCLAGDIQCRLWPRTDAEREQAEKLDLPLDRVLRIDDLVGGPDVCVSLTGVTDGERIKGVRYFRGGATTETLVILRRVTRRSHRWSTRGPFAQCP